MGKWKVTLNSSNIDAFLKGSEVQGLLRQRAARVGGDVEVYVAGTRAVARVSGNNKSNSLLKGLK